VIAQEIGAPVKSPGIRAEDLGRATFKIAAFVRKCLLRDRRRKCLRQVSSFLFLETKAIDWIEDIRLN
jgi:hypothetical protein